MGSVVYFSYSDRAIGQKSFTRFPSKPPIGGVCDHSLPRPPDIVSCAPLEVLSSRSVDQHQFRVAIRVRRTPLSMSTARNFSLTVFVASFNLSLVDLLTSSTFFDSTCE